jgi:hypothetical protein
MFYVGKFLYGYHQMSLKVQMFLSKGSSGSKFLSSLTWSYWAWQRHTPLPKERYLHI